MIPEDMLYGDESELQRHIQTARLSWTAAGFEGKSSSFVIAILSEKLCRAIPSETVKQIALRICSLYLQEPVEADRIYSDRIWLEHAGSRRFAWEWVVGVNYFSAQGDGRWWQDHRFPAGMAFSMNSVGHMVKSGKLNRAVHDLEEVMGTSLRDYSEPKVDSLEKALELAMRTINYASETVSGKATFLVPTVAVPGESRPACPIKLPPMLSGFDYCTYKGFYHTDYSIPSEYFIPDVVRPKAIEARELDFTYLFHEDLDNPDYNRMGEGRRIRTAEPDVGGVPIDLYPAVKRLRGVETEVLISSAARLRKALGTED
jgi:hypothetical protein